MPEYVGRQIREEMKFFASNIQLGFGDSSALERILGEIAKQCGVEPKDIRLVAKTKETEDGEEHVEDIYIGCENPDPERSNMVDVRELITQENLPGINSGKARTSGNDAVDETPAGRSAFGPNRSGG